MQQHSPCIFWVVNGFGWGPHLNISWWQIDVKKGELSGIIIIISINLTPASLPLSSASSSSSSSPSSSSSSSSYPCIIIVVILIILSWIYLGDRSMWRRESRLALSHNSSHAMSWRMNENFVCTELYIWSERFFFCRNQSLNPYFLSQSKFKPLFFLSQSKFKPLFWWNSKKGRWPHVRLQLLQFLKLETNE